MTHATDDAVTDTRRALAYLGLTDDVPPLVRGSKAWWVRAGVFALLVLVVVGLVAVGG